MPTEFGEAVRRLVLGLFKKFAVADTLAIIALNPQVAGQITHPGWLWVMLYAYALQIYFDFSGYTDIALGMARVLGIQLPENFNKPYGRTNLTQFWNNWHMTLTQWVRAYFFNPVTRWTACEEAESIPAAGHGHRADRHHAAHRPVARGDRQLHYLGVVARPGIVRRRTAIRIGPNAPLLAESNRIWGKRLVNFGGWFLTFQYVAFGWVWFCLPDMGSALRVFAGLLGIGIGHRKSINCENWC